MEPVGRRTRSRTLRSLIKQRPGNQKKHKSASDDVIVLSSSSSESPSRSPASDSTGSKLQSPDLLSVKKEVKEEPVEDDEVVFVSVKPASCDSPTVVVISSSSESEDASDDSDSDSDFDEDGDGETRSGVRKRVGPENVDQINQDEDEQEQDDDDDDADEVENPNQEGNDESETVKPVRREKTRPLTVNEIHQVLLNSILEEASTNVAESPHKKPHEKEDTSSSDSSDVDFDEEMDANANNSDDEELASMYRMIDFHRVDRNDNAAVSAVAATCLEDDARKGQEQLCNEGKHYLILNEEIGVICKSCCHVREEMKHVLPPFHENPFGDSYRDRYFENNYKDPHSLCNMEDPNIDSRHSIAEFDSTGTVWEIIPGIRQTLFPHQREAFEFAWRNVNGGTELKELMVSMGSEGGGCLISHDPGTGKTRLAIAFLESHMKFYKNSRPLILAPAGILLTWKKEFQKWKVGVPFLNLNDKELTEQELSIVGSLFGLDYERNLTTTARRLIKLLFWMKHESVLAISYTLFTQLAGGEDSNEKLKEWLLKMPGLLILDEGHMPRNEKSQMFDVLSGLKTKKRVLLSGTPFQNNFRELYNILGLVRKEFVAQENPFKKRGVDESDEAKIRAFKDKIKPYYHHYKKYIVAANTPGLYDNVVYLQPSEHQNELLKEEAMTEKGSFRANVNMTLISVHPMLLRYRDTNPNFQTELKNSSWSIDDGPKMKFLLRLIELSSALKEKVLVFSQFLLPLKFIKTVLMSEDYFGWRQDIEILFMSGNQDMESRERTMTYFNKKDSEAKVMLASTKACSEGIELTGASRVVMLDVTWNPSVEEQAISRAYRMGQKKAVHVYHLILTDNDSNIHMSQTKKKKFSKYMFLESGKKTGAAGLSKSGCVDVILERLLEERIIKEATQEKASDLLALSNGF